MRIALPVCAALLLYGCGESPHPELDLGKENKNFLCADASVASQPTMRQQRNLAFYNAKFTLGMQVKNQVTRFMESYLEAIGVRDEKQIATIAYSVNQELETLLEKAEQKEIVIEAERAMRITACLEPALFTYRLEETIRNVLKNERIVWARFQEQSSQDLLHNALESFRPLP